MKRQRTIFLLGGVLVLLLGVWVGISMVRTPVLNSVARGWKVADAMGCFGCHGANGTGGFANPRADDQEIPAWDGGMLTMYVKDEDEIRDWIRYGSLGHQEEHAHSTQRGIVPMPAYGSFLSEQELDDLVDLVKAIGSFNERPMPPEARNGFEVASRFGCFACHTLGGRLGVTNPGSFKGYIPPWLGDDFSELVRDEQELEQWILEGESDRLRANSLAQFFLTRQAIKMPAYKDVMTKSELKSVSNYIKWLRGTDAESF